MSSFPLKTNRTWRLTWSTIHSRYHSFAPAWIMCATLRVSLAGRLHESSGCLYPEVLRNVDTTRLMKTHRSPWTIVITSSSEVSIIFLNFFGPAHAFSKTSGGRGQGTWEGVRSFHVTAAVGCFRMEPRFSRSGLIVARGALCIQTCTFRSPKLFMQLINCFNIESCERGTVTDMALSEDSFCQLNFDFQVILNSQKGWISTV